MPASLSRAHVRRQTCLRLVSGWLLVLGSVLGLGLLSAPVAAADDTVTAFTDVRSTAEGCESVVVDGIDPTEGVRYYRTLTEDELSFPATLRYDSTGTVVLRAEAAAGVTLSGATSYTLRAPADCFPEATADVEPQTGAAPTWCTADPDASIELFVNGDYLADDESLSWRLVPQSTDPDVEAVATGALPAGLYLGNAQIARPDGVALGRYDLEFQVPGGQGFPVATVPVLVADCVSLEVACGKATFTNPDTNGDASVNVLPAGGGFSEARNVEVPSGGTGTIDVSDLTDGFGWVAFGPDGQIGSEAVVAASSGCEVTGTRPVIVGKAVLGNRLTVQTGDWGPGEVELAYRWYRDGVRISGADGPSHRVGFADYGHRLKVRVTGHRDGYTDTSLTSASTARVLFLVNLPVVRDRR